MSNYITPDHITPGRVATLFCILLGLWVSGIALRELTSIVQTFDTGWYWGLLIDITSVLSLLITISILADLNGIRTDFKRKVVAPSHLEKLSSTVEELSSTAMGGPQTQGAKLQVTTRKLDAVATRIPEVMEDSQIEEDIEKLRNEISNYTPPREGQEDKENEADAIDILATARSIETRMETLIDESALER